MVVDVIANFSGVVEVDRANFCDIEALSDENVKSVRHGEEEQDGLHGHIRAKLFHCLP